MIVGFDTATASTAVAVLRADGAAFERRDDPAPGARPRHAQALLALAGEALRAAGGGWGDVERLAVGVGPGGFTGLRIGIVTARALAQARGLPLVGVGSLHALAAGVGEAPAVWAVLDARRGEVFAARFAAGAVTHEPAALAPAALAARAAGGGLAVGDGSVRFRAVLEPAGLVVPEDGSPLHRLQATSVCRLAASAQTVTVADLLPDYRREPDAQPRPPTP